MIDAIVLAGGFAPEILADEASGKGLLEMNGKPMVDYVVEALKESDLIDRIAVVLPRKHSLRSEDDRVIYVPLESGSICSTIMAGVEQLETPDSKNVLIVSADIPLLSREAIDDFIGKSIASGAKICYPIIPERALKMRFPEAKRTYARLADGVFTGGNMGLVSVAVLKQKIDFLESVYERRKSPVKLTRILGIRFVLKFLLGRMSVSDVEKRISNILGAEGRAVRTEFSEVGFDIDKRVDLEIALREMMVRSV